MNQKQANYRVSVKGLVFDDQNRVLLVREDDDTWWGLPGGGLDHGEDIETALRREMREEVGAEVASFDPVPLVVWPFLSKYPDPPTYVFWVVYRVKLAAAPTPTEHGVKFFDVADITPEVLPEYFAPAYDEFMKYLHEPKAN